MKIDNRLLGPRVEAFAVDVLDPNENQIRTIRKGLSASVEQNVDAVIRGGMSFQTSDEGLEWGKIRFRPKIWVNGLSWTLGVYLPSSPEEKRTETGIVFSVPCLDKLVILDQHKFPYPVSIPAGTIITAAVKSFIVLAGETSMVVTDSTLTVPALMVWPAGTSALKVVNDLLGTINYSGIWCDRAGRYRVEPYLLPANRVVDAEFRRGETAIHSPRMSRTQDIASVPNQVVLTTSGTDTDPALIAVSENTDPSSPFSYQSRGERWITKTYDNVDAADQGTLDDLALRYLQASSSPPDYLEVEHAAIPLEPNSVVRFSTEGIEVLAVVNEMKIQLKKGSLMSGKWVVV